MGNFLARFFATGPSGDGDATSFARPIWQAKSVLVAAVLTLVGGYQWVTNPKGSTSANLSTNPPATTLMAANDPAKANHADAKTPEGAVPAIQPDSPALFRFGSSYAGGFFLGMLIRRFVKWSLIAAGVATAGLVALQKTGLIHLDWASLQAHVQQSLAWVQGHAAAFEHFLTGYLPSAGAGAAGLFMGRRH